MVKVKLTLPEFTSASGDVATTGKSEELSAHIVVAVPPALASLMATSAIGASTPLQTILAMLIPLVNPELSARALNTESRVPAVKGMNSAYPIDVTANYGDPGL